MHPTFSIVLFTTAAGAGFGLLFLLGLGVPLGLLPPDPLFGLAGLGTAFVFAVGGLASSVFHLGRPERAWRAFSQWRSSWLSREGVLSVATAIAATIFGVGWVFFGVVSGFVGLCGAVAAALAAGTIYCTGMIYASLKPIHQWRNRWTVPNYFALALMEGFLLLDLLIRFWVVWPVGTPILTMIVIAVGLDPQRNLLALYRHEFGSAERRERHRARPKRPRPHARTAAYAGQLPAAGNGLPDRAQAPHPAASDRADRRLRACPVS